MLFLQTSWQCFKTTILKLKTFMFMSLSKQLNLFLCMHMVMYAWN